MPQVTILSTQKYAGHMIIKLIVDQTTYFAEGPEDFMRHFEKLLYASSKRGFSPFATAAWHKIKGNVKISNLDKPIRKEMPECVQMDLFQSVK